MTHFRKGTSTVFFGPVGAPAAEMQRLGVVDEFLAMVQENGPRLERWAVCRELADMAADLQRRIEAG